MKKNGFARIAALILLFCLVFSCAAPCSFALEDPVLPAEAVLLADLDSGEILYEKNIYDRRSPASLTKIMTCLLAIEALDAGQCTMDDMVTAADDCLTGLSGDSSTAGITPGETMSFKDLFYCAMIHSANEACNVLGTYISGSISAFVSRMNERALELGCTDTHFLDPNGLSNEGHYTTAYDLYLITKEALKHPEFMTACNAVYYDTQPTNKSDSRSMYNSNALITTGSVYGDSYLYEGAAGVKTGYTRAAGYCLVSTAQRNDINAIAIVMGCMGQLNSGDNWDGKFYNFVSSINLYDWLFDNFSYRTILDPAAFGVKVHIEYAEGDGIFTLHPTDDVTVLLPNDVTEDMIHTEVTVFEDRLKAPIKAGTQLGEVRVSVDGKEYGSLKLVNSIDIDMSRSAYLKLRLTEFFSQGWVISVIVILLALTGIYIVLVARYRRLRRKHLRELRRAEKQRRIEREKLKARQKDYYEEEEEQPSYSDRKEHQKRTEAEKSHRKKGHSDFDELMDKFDKYM